jgi:predicted RNA binding protein YcfA (HicA-like mRNA interferase family)
MCIIHTMKSTELIKLMEKDGWHLVAVKGSHHQFKHPTKTGRVTVPYPKKDLGLGLVRAILKQAGLEDSK